jgi:hypothetical protein
MAVTINDCNAFFWQTDRERLDWQNLFVQLSILSSQAQLTKSIF